MAANKRTTAPTDRKHTVHRKKIRLASFLFYLRHKTSLHRRCRLLTYTSTFARTMKFVSSIPPFIYNKYYLATALVTEWVLFFDRNDVFTQMQRRKELAEIERSKDYFAKKITEGKEFSTEVLSNPDA